MRRRLLFLWVWSNVVTVPAVVEALSFPLHSAAPRVVQVCQNKDCCRQWTSHHHQLSLPDTIQDLLPPDVQVQIETTGCLSRCGKGPNLALLGVSARTTDGSQPPSQSPQSSSSAVIIQSMNDPLVLAKELEHYFDFRIPTKLVAAVTVMEKARRANTFQEKEQCLSSVIRVLQNDPLLRGSTANLRAHIERAQIQYEYGMIEEALRDINQVLAMAPPEQDLPQGTDPKHNNNALMGTLVGRAYRTAADCFLTLEQTQEAEHALLKWAHVDPSCRTKAMKEIQLLRQSL